MEAADYWRGRWDARAWLEGRDIDAGRLRGEMERAMQHARTADDEAQLWFFRGYAAGVGKALRSKMRVPV